MKIRMTGSQQAKFRPLKAQAWAQYCLHNPTHHAGDRVAERTWYERQLLELFGVTSTSDVSWTVRRFDELCQHFATRSGDDQAIEYWSKCDERRVVWMIDSMLKVLECEREYALAIARQMGYLRGDVVELIDMPCQHLYKVATALNNKCKKTVGRDVWKEICRRVQLPDLPVETEEDLSADLVCDPVAEPLPF